MWVKVGEGDCPLCEPPHDIMTFPNNLTKNY